MFRRNTRKYPASITRSTESSIFFARRSEDLDAVVLIRIVRRADHHAGVGLQFSCQKSDAGCCDYSSRQTLPAGPRSAFDERALDPFAGLARVAANDDLGCAF